jgi:hypothetical protein
MKIYKLIPLNPTDAAWRYYTHKGEVIVRAVDERGARALASQKFKIFGMVNPNRGARFDPWRDESQVSVQELFDTSYRPDGEPGVLEPK